MGYEEILEELYVGKKITVDLNEEVDGDLEWDGYWSDDEEEEVLGGEGHMELDYRDYLSDEDIEDPADEEDDEEEEEEEYDERLEWKLGTGVDFSVDDDGMIESICITASVSCVGDSGLGDCDPEYEWTDRDLELAKEFFDRITKQDED